MPNLFAVVREHPVAFGVAGAAGAAGLFAATHRFAGDDNRELTTEQQIERFGSRFTGGAVAGLGVAGLGFAAYQLRQPIVQASAFAGRVAYDQAVTRPLARAASLRQTLLGRGVGEVEASAFAYTRSPILMLGGGAAAGGLIGAAYGHPGMGAAIGAAAGAAAQVGVGAGVMWKNAGSFKRGLIIGALTTAAFAGGMAMAPSPYASESTAMPDAGDVSYAAGVKDRLAMMSASGDMVLGLNRGRHG